MPRPERKDVGERRIAGETRPLLRPLDAEYATLRFDYTEIKEEHRTRVQDAAVDIRRRERRAAEDMIAIGQRLMEVKDLLPHGQFSAWVETEFHYSMTSAQEFMKIARRFGGKNTIIVFLPPTVIRLLAAPSVSDEAVEAVVATAQAAEKPIKVREVKQIIASHSAPAKVRQSAPAIITANYTVIGKGRSEASVPTTALEDNQGKVAGAVPAAKVTISLDRTVAEKLYVAVTRHSLRYLSKDEQAQLIQALEVILAP